jgi:exopolysaccharide biosynthesis polyprenyl glycosylphosphotransferase
MTQGVGRASQPRYRSDAGAEEIETEAEPPATITRAPAVSEPDPAETDGNAARKAAARQWLFRTGPARRQPRHSDESKTIREGVRPDIVLQRDARFRRALAVADMSAAAVSVVAVIVAAGGVPKSGVLVALPGVVLASKVGGLYDRDEHLLRKTTLEEAPALLQTATVVTLLAFLLGGALVEGGFDKPQLLALWVLLTIALLSFRAVARRIVLKVTPAERCVVIGDVSAAERIEGKLRLSHSMKATLVGRVRMSGNPRELGGPPELGPLGDLDFILRAHRIDRVIIAPNARDTEETLDTIRLVKALGVKVSVLPRLFEVIGSSVEFDDCDGITLLGVRQYGLTKSSAALKRAFDVAGAVAGLVVLAPLFALIALAIKVTSRGPVFFQQERIGRGGEIFRMLKFRTMCVEAEDVKQTLLAMNEARGLFKIADDPRLTRVGRLLRRCSLDELPQLLNVVGGEMSLVGPRPLVPEEDNRIEGWQRTRLDVMPGMTGIWQVLGSSRVPLHEMVKVDYIYRTNWSIWLDIKILVRTVPLVLMRRNH